MNKNFFGILYINHITGGSTDGGQNTDTNILVNIHEAIQYGNIQKLTELLGNTEGKKVINDEFNGYTPLFRIIMNTYGYWQCYGDILVNMMKLLLDNGADPNIQNNGGFTPLIQACYLGNIRAVKILIDKGADVNIKTKLGVNAIQKASYNGYADIVELLISNGANVNEASNVGKTPLMKAVELGGRTKDRMFEDVYNRYKRTIKILIKNGAKLDVSNKYGDKIVDHSVRTGIFDYVCKIAKKHFKNTLYPFLKAKSEYNRLEKLENSEGISEEERGREIKRLNRLNLQGRVWNSVKRDLTSILGYEYSKKFIKTCNESNEQKKNRKRQGSKISTPGKKRAMTYGTPDQ